MRAKPNRQIRALFWTLGHASDYSAKTRWTACSSIDNPNNPPVITRTLIEFSLEVYEAAADSIG